MNTRDLEKQARSLLRVMGPRVSAAQDEQVNFRHCITCDPPAKVYRCVICGFASENKWCYDAHNLINPETCQRIADKKARVWAQQV